jgi:hypothetical protein
LADIVKGCEFIRMEALVGLSIWDLDAQPTIEIAGDVVALDHLGDFTYTVLEALDGPALMANEAHRDQGCQDTTTCIWINDRPITTNYSFILKAS